ncbi:MAG TPA: SGNH/GDSL hydrolase family protein, partial [Bacteroidales bacterium]|nr:SGNH/GDSL hydrolase family protein [Bacteroidales bacterium]
MKIIILLATICIGIQSKSIAQPYKISNDVERIVFLGNSITYQGIYIEFIDAYYTLHYPEKTYEFLNVGLPSETVSGLSEPNHAKGKFPRPVLRERLTRVLAATNPDLVFSCYGMNDGIYMPFDEERFQKYKDGIHWLNEEIEKAGAEIIHITPPIYDERKGAAYANVLDIYSDWLISNRYINGWRVIDIHWPMRKALEDYRAADSTFVFANDGIHPSVQGHFEMAKFILRSLEEPAMAEFDDPEAYFSTLQNGKQILSLVQSRQKLSKDAWLTHTGHKRPNMKKGLPLDEAQEKMIEIEQQIKMLIAK